MRRLDKLLFLDSTISGGLKVKVKSNIKNTDDDFKIKLIESLWKIIYSDENSDIYESNLMRRLSGLLYLDKKIVGDIKEKVKRNFNK